MVEGSLRLVNHGRMRIGARVRILSRPVPIELATGPGAELEVGDDTVLEPGVSVSSNSIVVIGQRVRIGRYSMIIDSNYHDLYERDVRPPAREVHIGDDVVVGAHSCILPGVRIGAGAVVVAGAVVTRDVAPGSTVAGVPATVLPRPFPSTVPGPPA